MPDAIPSPDDYTTAENVAVILGKTYICTCPDYQGRSIAHPQSPYKSRRVDNDWRAGRSRPNIDCKHIMAVKATLGVVANFVDPETGIEIPFPEDLPIT